MHVRCHRRLIDAVKKAVCTDSESRFFGNKKIFMVTALAVSSALAKTEFWTNRDNRFGRALPAVTRTLDRDERFGASRSRHSADDKVVLP